MIHTGRVTYDPQHDLCRMQLDHTFWNDRYLTGETGWDLGGPSTPLKEYLDQLPDKDLRILIPGGGKAWEAEYAHRLGFKNVLVIDLTDAPFKELLDRCPVFPKEHLIVGDFFAHQGQYDRILEQTFFCALDPALRSRYVRHMPTLLAPGGKLVGVLFDDPLNTDKPPFGGSRAEYEHVFAGHFASVSFTPCHNSIAPRAGRELWLCAIQSAVYEPIDCSLYDTYEAAATKREHVHLTMNDDVIHDGIIVDLYIRDKAEWLRLDNGTELRLDGIRKMDSRRSE